MIPRHSSNRWKTLTRFGDSHEKAHDFSERAGLLRACAVLGQIYDDNRNLSDMKDLLADFFSRLPPRPSRLIDLGCGAGEARDCCLPGAGWKG